MLNKISYRFVATVGFLLDQTGPDDWRYPYFNLYKAMESHLRLLTGYLTY